MKKLLTKLESSTIANVSVRTIEHWMKNGVLSYIKIRGIVRIPEDALLDALNRHLIKGWNTRKKDSAIGD
jgi:excisionase family DNA binding protein